LDELVGGGDRIPGNTQRPGEHIRRATGNHRYRGYGAEFSRRCRAWVPKQTVDHPADRSVAAMDDDQIHSVRSGGLPEFGPVTAVVGVFDGELEAAF